MAKSTPSQSVEGPSLEHPAPAQPAGRLPSKKRRGPRPKHVPQRTCIACRTNAPKRALVRVVRTSLGHVVIDPTGKLSGRGASICGTRSCWQRALTGQLLDRALRITIAGEDRATLEAYMATLTDPDIVNDSDRRDQTAESPAAGSTSPVGMSDQMAGGEDQ